MKTNILLVEDNPGDRELISILLKKVDDNSYNITSVTKIGDAYSQLSVCAFEIVLLDLSLPDATGGLETIRNFFCEIQHVPLIVLTGVHDKKLGLEAVKLGAQDFIVKGNFDHNLLSKTIDYSIERFRLIEALRNMALVDTLTDLYNRNGFMSLGEQKFAFAIRQKLNISLFFIDLDNLKKINDNYGHEQGDKALKDTAHILTRTMRGSDLIARLGGDEFVILAFTAKDDNTVMDRIHEATAAYNIENQTEWELSMSIGECDYDINTDSDKVELKDLIQKADELMYKQKQLKRNNR